MSRINHGWLVLEEPAPGMKEPVLVEWNEGNARKQLYMKLRGNSGCAQAIEWWENKLNKRITLEPLMKGCYRVYTEEA